MTDDQPKTIDEKLDALLSQGEDISIQGERLILSYKEYRRRRWYDRALVALFVVLMAFVAYNSAQNRVNGNRIVDCTTPGPTPSPVATGSPSPVPGAHACYDRGRQQTADAVAQIVTANTAQVVKVGALQRECLKANPQATEKQLESCVFAGLATGR